MSNKPILPNSQPKPAVQPPGKKVDLPGTKAANNPSAQDEMLQKLIARMAEEDPAGVAEIIRMWLKQDQK
jgi:flagellar biosynthesis/type III secretory pathway M-ring protein FliF/YscJ